MFTGQVTPWGHHPVQSNPSRRPTWSPQSERVPSFRLSRRRPARRGTLSPPRSWGWASRLDKLGASLAPIFGQIWSTHWFLRGQVGLRGGNEVWQLGALFPLSAAHRDLDGGVVRRAEHGRHRGRAEWRETWPCFEDVCAKCVCLSFKWDLLDD